MSNDLQRGSLVKRLAAWILDFMLLLTLVVGVAAGLSAILGYDAYQTRLSAIYEKYETQYGVDFESTQEDYDAMTWDQQERYDAAGKALSSDKEAIYAYNMIISLTILIISLAIFFGVLITELILPLILKNGQTLGKKVFGLGVIRTDGVKASGVQLFVRSILGKYAVEIMIPVFVVIMLFFQIGGIVFVALALGILLSQVLLLIINRNKMLIHDLLARTVVVDLPSQMVFGSTEDLIAYKNKIHAEEVSRQSY